MQAVCSASLASMHEHAHTHARVSVYVRYIGRCRRVRPIFQQCSTRLLLDAETQIHSPVEPSQRNKDDTSIHGSYLARYSSTLRVPTYAMYMCPDHTNTLTNRSHVLPSADFNDSRTASVTRRAHE